MKIIKLTAENFKKLVAVEITPNGNLVEITGKNGSGKSSTLDAIWSALAGLTAAPKEPVRKGENTARIRLDMGEIVVTRTFKKMKDGEATSSLVVENANGVRFQSPQSMLDQLLGKMSFDPLQFARMKPREQFDTLKVFVPEIDFDKMAEETEKDFDARTDLNRQIKSLRTLAENIPVVNGLPTEKIDESALVKELEAAGKHNADIQNRLNNRQTLISNAKRLKDTATEIHYQIEELEKKMAAMLKDEKEIIAKVDSAPALPDPLDTSVLTAKIIESRKTNESVNLRNKRADYIKEAETLQAQANKLTEAMQAREDVKRSAIANAKLPVDSVTFGDGSILLGGVPFEQASDAEQLRASVGMAIALNPKLRVIRVKDGSLLDKDSMKILSELADKEDCQVWIETVNSDGRMGFTLENGYLKEESNV